ncbi:hypothetical protein fugu_000111 [Takifugu bimaculatus]|uniref:Uncharacterized protein n=1 Tax=Takifugu bimaculatus TaxID=433685 RepID=A0A4Z2CFS1_9TELE|nr:hypothetical protein fugu_000111 [Takifugu bimaculatus]
MRALAPCHTVPGQAATFCAPDKNSMRWEVHMDKPLLRLLIDNPDTCSPGRPSVKSGPTAQKFQNNLIVH